MFLLSIVSAKSLLSKHHRWQHFPARETLGCAGKRVPSFPHLGSSLLKVLCWDLISSSPTVNCCTALLYVHRPLFWPFGPLVCDTLPLHKYLWPQGWNEGAGRHVGLLITTPFLTRHLLPCGTVKWICVWQWVKWLHELFWNLLTFYS